ncbi:MAG: T9SS type A sorting domain-containing protein [Bacteroidetes bacterium]|nr:T9SS type A sorting domain-containing protein [Bacteroidota bacterium]
MGYYPGSHTTVLDEITFEKWGLNKPKKVFEQYILHPPVYSLTQDIGLDSIYSYFDFGDTWIVLKGCIINGVVYGDTTVVSVEDETQNLPTEFSLSQNYPNPFNPSTRIQYAISSKQFVSLKVYDVLGNEIATLVNKELPAGSYVVEFNIAQNSILSSGVYFYQLKAGNFIETEKMILVK